MAVSFARTHWRVWGTGAPGSRALNNTTSQQPSLQSRLKRHPHSRSGNLAWVFRSSPSTAFDHLAEEMHGVLVEIIDHSVVGDRQLVGAVISFIKKGSWDCGIGFVEEIKL